MDKKKILLADSALFITALVWGSGFVAVKNALDFYSPMHIMIIRFTIAALLTLVLFWKHISKTTLPEIKAGIVIGIFMFLGFAFQTIGLQYTLAGKQAFLTGTNVIMVPFLFWIIKKEKPDSYNLAAAFMMVLGIALLTIDFSSSFSFNPGDILTIICAFFFALHIISIGIFTKKYDPIRLTFIQFATTSALSFIWTTFVDKNPFYLPADNISQVLYLGLFSTFLAFLLQNVAQKYTTSTHAAIILSLESFFGSILAILLLGDKFTPWMILGSTVIFLGILTAETKWNFLKKGVLNEL
ncbi:MAG: DMT family transporter [Eubacteriaceae bacterium]|nr:DMT family transporter [Eubacteriaceae bacterium]